jgi:hypothetical protein
MLEINILNLTVRTNHVINLAFLYKKVEINLTLNHLHFVHIKSFFRKFCKSFAPRSHL